MSDPSESKGSCERQNNKGLRRSYDSNFKLMVSVKQRKQTIVLLESSASLKITLKVILVVKRLISKVFLRTSNC
jgi:hypothetical protein